ncbi:MAG TPA: NUDIX domain-containing protein [Ramlibacter sp.]|jgi:predicted NUDIX family NTP pyrophosphohydrolase|uniref:NUDIX domain-containing protein n=1 Tax=Ramlibacter sp. TaxID=1917967 RepID=UPI002D3ED163|nr:NUDIX domain-containing protein [Ramlibacter sp.]HZY19332.1 NUDIX domain-containing protein [Ramlibacter sp.]
MTSAGLLLYRRGPGGLQVLLAHPGGPFWARRDDGAWTLPKGEVQPDEDALAAARREFAEETGMAPQGEVQPLGEVRQRGGKRVLGWALEGDFDPAMLRSNEFELEWPPRSGRRQRFAEVDRVAWFDLDLAQAKLLDAQRPFLDRLAALVSPD